MRWLEFVNLVDDVLADMHNVDPEIKMLDVVNPEYQNFSIYLSEGKLYVEGEWRGN